MQSCKGFVDALNRNTKVPVGYCENLIKSLENILFDNYEIAIMSIDEDDVLDEDAKKFLKSLDIMFYSDL